MAMFDSNIDYTKFIQFNENGGLRVATFPEIRDALVRRYKEIYGNDIDTSSVSADGQFINSIALIINNICSTFEFSFKQMNPNTATGKYLDVLCSYNNVRRITSTNSTAELFIHNTTAFDIPGSDLYFIDRNNNTWKWICPLDADGNPRITFKAGSNTPIDNIICETKGSVLAYGSLFIKEDGTETDDIDLNDWNRECPGDIYQFVNVNNDLKLWQFKDAEVGKDDESDESLRSRRNQTLGITSISILEGLRGALLNLTGIKDVFIYNNDTANDKTLSDPLNDGTTIAPHNIYIALRYEEGVEIDDYTIGQIIYNRLTPGVATQIFNGSDSGVEKSYEFKITSNISHTVYWKQCAKANPIIQLMFVPNSNYNFSESPETAHNAITDVERNIVKNLQNYINNVKIDSYLQISELLTVLQQSDIQKNGRPTFFVQQGRFGTGISVLQITPANLSYFKYKNTDYKFTYVSGSNIMVLDIEEEE